MKTFRLAAVSLDCSNPAALAEFWAALLEADIAFSSDEFVAIKLEGLWVTAVRVESYRPPTWPDESTPKQIHFEVAVRDLDSASASATTLGATQCEHQPAPDRYRVFLDPAGHPFCLTTQIPE